MLGSLPLLPILAGLAIGVGMPAEVTRRKLLLAASAVVSATLALALGTAISGATASYVVGSGLVLRLAVPPMAGTVAVLIPAIALPVVAYAAAHEDRQGLVRLIGLLVAFVGAMELLVVAADLLLLVIGWELVGAISWALISHQWRDPTRPARAAHAYLVTRGADLGLVLAAGAAFAATGSLAYDDLLGVDGTGRHVLVGGIVLAALAKSAQLPFSPWLFSAMAGPTSASALLHAATMVAAGAYLLARLEPVLAASGWARPTVLAVGLATALLGGGVALVQSGAKHVLAASTAAQHGLMLVAVGAGFPAVAITHLVAHAALKALLFLAVGNAMSAVGSDQLGAMRLGRALRITAVAAAIGSLALAAVPPLGAAWTKEEVVAAAGHAAAPLAVLVVIAGGLSAAYAARLQLLAFGPDRDDERPPPVTGHPPGPVECTAVTALAAASVLLGLLWWPTTHRVVERLGSLPSGMPWELAASLVAVAIGIYAVVSLDRTGRLGVLGITDGPLQIARDWFGLPALSRRVLADPTLALAASLARADDRLDRGVDGLGRRVLGMAGIIAHADMRSVDAGVRAVAGAGQRLAKLSSGGVEAGIDGLVRSLVSAVGSGGRDARRVQTGMVHHSLTTIAVGAAVMLAVAAIWR